jgi:protein-disulfide isomerase
METQNNQNNTQRNPDYMLPVSILIAGVLIAGAVLYKNPSGSGAPLGQDPGPQVVSGEGLELNAGDVILGDPNAPVTLIEYSDFQCPFCGRFYSQTEPLIKENYVQTGKVKFVYRHFAFLGPESRAAANAVECAKDQGAFWQFHDEIFEAEIRDGREHNGNLDRPLFLSIAQGMGFDMAEYTSCLDTNKYADKVESDYAVAQTLGVAATPTIFVNDKMIEGALPYENFRLIIEQELAK